MCRRRAGSPYVRSYLRFGNEFFAAVLASIMLANEQHGAVVICDCSGCDNVDDAAAAAAAAAADPDGYRCNITPRRGH